MITARTAMESRVEILEGRLRELRKEYQSRLDEIKQLWKRRKGDYSRRRSRRDHAPSRRRRTPTMYAEEKDAEEEENARGSDGSSNSVLYTVTEPETQTEGEMKANREIPEEDRSFQVAHKVETEEEVDVSNPSEMKTEKEGDSGDISDLSEMKTKNQSCCRSRNDNDRCVGGGGGSLVEIMSSGGRVMPPSDMGLPKAKAESLSGMDELPLSAPPYHSPCLGAVNTVFVKVGMEVLPPPEPPDLDIPKAEVRSSSDVTELPMTAPLLVSPDPCPCLATVKTMAMKGGREVLTLLNLFVLMKMRWGAEGTWPTKLGFIAEALVKHKALRGTKIEVPSVRGPAYIFSANLSVEICTNSMMHGDLCNSTTHPPSCTPSDIHYAWEATINKPMLENVEACKSNFEMSGIDEDIPRGAAGGNTQIRLSSDRSDKIYVGFGGSSSLGSLNYVYANKTRRSGPFMFFMPYDSSDGKVDFYLMYASREGTWSSGLRHFNTSSDSSKAPTIMSLSLERCPKRCSSHGDCNLSFDTSGLTSYSFCFCDQHHEDFDCRIEIATRQGKVWQAIFLIVWNAGAILLAYWSLKQKALAEWVKFTFSGTLSYIFNNFQGGRVFNEVVAEAKEAGYTEPDTRNALSGTNVAVEAADIVLVQSSLEEVLKWWQNWVPQIELTSPLGSLTSDGRDIPVAGKKQWDPGGQRHTTTVAPQSGFK